MFLNVDISSYRAITLLASRMLTLGAFLIQEEHEAQMRTNLG